MATKGYKTLFGYGDQGTEGAIGDTFTDLAKVTDINGIAAEAEDIETSNMDSPNSYKEFVAGWADAGTVDLKLQFDKEQQGAVFGLFRQDISFRLRFVDGSTWTMNGFVKKFGNEIEREKLVTVTATVKVSGEPVFTAGS